MKIMKRKCTIPKEEDKIKKRFDEIEKKIEEYKKRKAEQVKKKDAKKEEWKRKNKMIVEDHWGMLRWLHQYIEENKIDWEKRRMREKEEVDEEYEKWKGMEEEDMIEILINKEEEIEMEKMRKETRKKEQKEMRKYMEDNEKMKKVGGGEVMNLKEKDIPLNVTKEVEVVEDPPLDPHNQTPPNIPDNDKHTEETEKAGRIRDMKMKKEEMLQRRKKWKEDHKVTIDIEKVTHEIQGEGRLVGDPLLDSEHHLLLTRVEEEDKAQEERKKKEDEEGLEELLEFGTMCLVCVHVPCICDLTKLEEKIENLRKEEKRKE